MRPDSVHSDCGALKIIYFLTYLLKVHHRSGVWYAGSHSADLAVGGQPAPLQHRSYLWLPLYSGLDVTYVTPLYKLT